MRLVGRDWFNEVFAHTRTIFLKEKAKKEFIRRVFCKYFGKD